MGGNQHSLKYAKVHFNYYILVNLEISISSRRAGFENTGQEKGLYLIIKITSQSVEVRIAYIN